MKKGLSFYVLYPNNHKIKQYINAIKILSDYNQRTEAHITVRGPYRKKLSISSIDKFSNIISGERLQVTAVQNFFAFGQSTVYFECGANDNLRRIWKKITYNDFKPHITIYDGNNRDFAIKLFNTLQDNFQSFYFNAGELVYLEPKKNDKLGLYRLKNIFDFKDFSSLIDGVIDIDDMVTISEKTRLDYIRSISYLLYTHQEI